MSSTNSEDTTNNDTQNEVQREISEDDSEAHDNVLLDGTTDNDALIDGKTGNIVVFASLPVNLIPKDQPSTMHHTGTHLF
eukprot:11050690-Ditylum_brightwellii.AAC.1